ncbi:MAG: pyridoxal phosphate-dependent aminotransferase [Flavobacteriales bacterium]
MELINRDWHGQLLEVRRILAGRNQTGLKAYNSMFDADVLSYAHGDGVSRPHPYVIAKTMEEFLTPENGSVDDYLYLSEDRELLDMLTADFVHDGIPFEIARNIALDNGSSALICHIMEQIIKQSNVKRVCAPASFYHNFPSWAEHYGLQFDVAQTERNNDYKMTYFQFNNYLKKNGNGIILLLQNPNHGGAIYKETELAKIAKVAECYKAWIVVDSVFSGTEYELDYTPALASVAGDNYARVVTVKSTSKRFNIANARIGWCCGAKTFITELKQRIVNKNVSISKYSIDLLKYSFKHRTKPTSSLKSCLRRVDILKRFVSEFNGEQGRELIAVEHEPEAGHGVILSLDPLVEGLDMESIDVCRMALDKFKLALSPGQALGYEGCKLRIAISSIGLNLTYGKSREERAIIINYLSGTQSEDELFSFPYNEKGLRKGEIFFERSLEKRFKPFLLHLGNLK